MRGRESQLFLAPGSMPVAAVSQVFLQPLLHAAQLCIFPLSQCLVQVPACEICVALTNGHGAIAGLSLMCLLNSHTLHSIFFVWRCSLCGTLLILVLGKVCPASRHAGNAQENMD